MKPEIWLRVNRRAVWFSAGPVAMLCAGGLYLIAGTTHPAAQLVGWCLVLVSLVLMVFIGRAARQPRLAYEPHQLLIYLDTGDPIRVPIEIVECFFLGQGPSMLPGSSSWPNAPRPQSANIVVRLAEAALEWKNVEVRPDLGQWCDSYITIRGTWCEPINAPLMQQLNQKLAAAHRQCRDRPKELEQ